MQALPGLAEISSTFLILLFLPTAVQPLPSIVSLKEGALHVSYQL